MADIARLANVTSMTVSRALRSPEKVTKETHQCIEAAIRQLGYIPDLLAGSLASNHTPLVALIVPTILATIYADCYAGISEALRARGYDILLGNSGYSLEHEEVLVSAFLSYRPAGLILTGYSHTERLRSLVLRSGIPVVETFNLTTKPLRVCVGFSNFQAMFEVTEHLILSGRKHPVFLVTEYFHSDRHADRRKGFEAALMAHGLHADESSFAYSKLSYADAGLVAMLHLANHPETDAFLCGSDVLAAGTLLACKRHGVAVPKRLAIAGFDDQELTSVIEPGITTVRVLRRDMGRQAAELLLHQIDGEQSSTQVVDIGYELILRGTT